MNKPRKIDETKNDNVLRFDERRSRDTSRTSYTESVRIKLEVACHEDTGETIETAVSSKLNAQGCEVTDYEKPDWILSIIAYSQGEMVEMSIVLRRLFRSTTPGTEVERVDSEGSVNLRRGGWLYESLRFHGLFGVRSADLDGFFDKLVHDLATNNWNRPSAKTVRRNY